MPGKLRQTLGTSILLALVAAPALLHFAAGLDVTAAATTHPLRVLGAAAGSVGLAMGLAAAMGLPAWARRLVKPKEDPEQVMHELAELAGVARTQGLLPALVEPRAHGRELFAAGVQLLLRDADEPLIRATLEAERDRLEQSRDQQLSMMASICRAASVGVLFSLVAAGAIMLRSAASPWTIVPQGAWIVLLTSLVGVSGWAASGPIIQAIRRALAHRALVRAAEVQVVESIRVGEDRELASRRLQALLPRPSSTEESSERVRRAA